MNRAYNEIYLEDAMRNLGVAFEYSKVSYNYELDDFLNMFINSGIANYYEKGISKYVSGTSGIELVLDILKLQMNIDYVKDFISFNYSCEYWCGWILAYIQWYFNMRFKDLHYYLKMTDLEKLYYILHETSEEKALEVICQYIQNKKLDTRLKHIRNNNLLSQTELAKHSGISLRMIQQYEQRKKDINKANVNTLRALSNTLNCDIEDLLEYDFNY